MKVRIYSRKIGWLLKETFRQFIADRGMKLSAALSYYTIFSLPPLLIIVIGVCGVFFGEEAVRGEIFGQINGFIGNAAALQVQETIKNVWLSNNDSFVTVVGLVILFIGASGVFSEIQDSINFIWSIDAKPKRGVVKFIKNRLMSFSMIGAAGFLLLVGLLVNSIFDLLYTRLAIRFPKDAILLFYVLNILMVFIIITLLFMLIFKTLPDGKIVLKDCFIGAAFTAVLFMGGKFAISAYLGSSAIATSYGAAGSVVLILVWVYYSAIILYFGAEFTKVYANAHGDKIVPNAYSVLIVKQNVEIEMDGSRHVKEV